MLEIKTIWSELVKSQLFDVSVNAAIADGWELVRREVLPRRTDWGETLLYAELERITEAEEEEEEELEEDDGTAEWKLSRDPLYPFRCTACGCKSQDALRNCPHCKRVMVMPE